VIWSRRANDIDGLVVEHSAHILDPLGTAARAFLDRIAAVLAHFLVHVNDVSDLAILPAGEGADVTAPATPAAYHCAKKPFIRALGLRLRNAAEHRGCGYRRCRSGKHRVLQELSASSLCHDNHSLKTC
jgi:hypothetical protein